MNCFDLRVSGDKFQAQFNFPYIKAKNSQHKMVDITTLLSKENFILVKEKIDHLSKIAFDEMEVSYSSPFKTRNSNIYFYNVRVEAHEDDINILLFLLGASLRMARKYNFFLPHVLCYGRAFAPKEGEINVSIESPLGKKSSIHDHFQQLSFEEKVNFTLEQTISFSLKKGFTSLVYKFKGNDAQFDAIYKRLGLTEFQIETIRVLENPTPKI